MNKDIDHLKLLGVFHIIWGVLSILFGLAFGILYIALGAMPNVKISGNLPPGTAQQVFMVIGVVVMVLSLIYGIMMIIAGGMFRKQRGYGFCFFISILDLFGFPGLVLGIFALIVLVRPTVKELFKGGGVLPSGTSPQTVSRVA
jgi:hypothetical protein